MTTNDLEPFFNKFNVISFQRNKRPFIALFIADHFDHAAFDKLKTNGILIARPGALFGEDIANTLTNLIGTIEHAAASITNDPEKVFRLLGSLSKLEGASLNLRSVVLEFIIAHLYKIEGYNIDMRKQVKDMLGKPAEIDIKAIRNDEVVCVECKAVFSENTVKKEDISDWMDGPFKTIKQWLKNTSSQPPKIRFEFWTSGNYDSDAENLIKEIKTNHKKVPIDFLNGEDLINRLREFNLTSIVDIFKEHFPKRI